MREKAKIEREMAEDTVCDKLEAGENVDVYFKKKKKKEVDKVKKFMKYEFGEGLIHHNDNCKCLRCKRLRDWREWKKQTQKEQPKNCRQ